MKKNIDLLNDYMANLFVEENNLNNMKLNVVGNSFFGLHRMLEEYQTKMKKMCHNIAIRIKMLGGYPLTSLKEIENISAIKSMQSRDYNGNQIFDVLENDFRYLNEYTNDIIAYFKEEKDDYTTFILEENGRGLKDEYWKIKSSLK